MRVPRKQRKETANMKSRIKGNSTRVHRLRTPGKHPQMEQRPLGVLGVLDDVRHAFGGLCARAGMLVLEQLMEEDRTALCGPKGVPQEGRRAVRGGTTPASVVLAGQRMAVQRQRARDLQGGELTLPSFAWASDRDPLDAATLAAVAAGVSTRRYAGLQPELPQAVRASADATSKSAVSRRFVALSQRQLNEWLCGSIAQLDLPVVMVDGIHLGDSVILVALGIDALGNKHILGLREGSTESTGVVKALLSELIERGLDADRARLWVIDGGKALRKGIVECFGTLALVQRCQEHKRRNVLEHLPEAMRLGTSQAMRQAWDGQDAVLAGKRLQALAGSLEAKHPGAAASLREGLAETLTVQGMGIGGWLYKTLRTTNPIENLNGAIARYTRNVKRWKDASMTRRWVASALHDAKGRFRKLRGSKEMGTLLAALNLHAQKIQAPEKRNLKMAA
jgi:putative transposase